MHRMADIIAQMIKFEYPEVDQQRIFDILISGFSFTQAGEFFVERCRITYDNYKIPFAMLYNAYVQWCDQKGYYPVTKRSFSTEMQRLGAKRCRWGTGVYFKRIVLRGTERK